MKETHTTHTANEEATMKATATQNADGTYSIEMNGEVIRKRSKKLFTAVYTFGKSNHKLSNDSQLRKYYGEATVTPIEAI